jgi:hypothetical protein
MVAPGINWLMLGAFALGAGREILKRLTPQDIACKNRR